MAFVNVSLLLGGLLTAVPIVLHLIMRQQPKLQVFPALRFLQKRRETNRRKLRLRQWLLLALRCAVVVLLALALARPSVSSEVVGNWAVIALLGTLTVAVLILLVVSVIQKRGRLLVSGLTTVTVLLLAVLSLVAAGTLRQTSGILLGEREAPVSAVLVFDTAPRMQYRYQNKTRLEAAQDIGQWLIGQLPADSQIAVVDARSGPAVFAVDLALAKKAVERLQVTGVPETLPTVLKSAINLSATGKHARREVYVFSDLTAASWPADSAGQLNSVWERTPETSLYVIDVGVSQPTNVALGQLQLSAQSLAKNSPLELQTELRNVGTGGAKVVELYLEEPDDQRPVIVDGKPLLPTAQRRGRQEVVLAEDGAQRLAFRLRALPPGVHQGYLAVTSEDGLAIDDIRYFTVEVKEAWPVLVVAPRGVNTSFFTQAISPDEFVKNKRERFACTVVNQADLANRTVESYTTVCLLDPEPLPPTAWEKLRDYVGSGGALAVFLGHNAQPVTSFNVEAARSLLGGTLTRPWRSSGRDLFLSPRRYDHPILAPFREQSTSVPWSEAPVFRHWALDQLSADTSVLLPYGNGKPALVETSFGRGRVLTMTTPISDRARPRGRSSWNELITSEEAWPCFVLINQAMQYLAGAGESRLNYLAGETALLANDPDKNPQRYQLFTPLEEPQEITARAGQLAVRFTERPGAYRLKGNRGGPVVRGFAVNLPPEASDLARLQKGQLDELLGASRYQLAKSQKEIVREVGETRVGREFYPYLLAVLAMVLGVESLLANRFYKRSEASQDAGAVHALGTVTKTA